MKRMILIFIFLLSTSFAIQERTTDTQKKPEVYKFYKEKDKDEDGIWDVFIKNLLKKTEKKEEKAKTQKKEEKKTKVKVEKKTGRRR